MNYTLKKTFVALIIFCCGTIAALGQNPVAAFTANTTSGCAPLTVTFNDQSTGNPTVWNWEFSNGTLSNVRNPTVTFSTPGTYSVKLVVQNATGIGATERIDYITVFPSPVGAFSSSVSLGCIPSLVNFTDNSTPPPGGSITAWEWDFGDGGTSTQQNPSHTYVNEGFYTVTLTLTSNTGCKTTISRGSLVRIVGGISTDFAFTQPGSCQSPFSVNFQNQSSGPGNVTYNWDFGNSQTSTAANPTAVYNAPGTYTVTLNAQSDLGCTGSIQKTITITSTATDFTVPANICLNQPATFQNASSLSPVSSFWDFGDGTQSAQINPVKTFIAPGTYDVKLINQYDNCLDSITKTVVVSDKPAVMFTADDSTSCSTPFNVQFTDQTGGATSWFWDFGDGTTSTLQNPSHQYTSFGNYNVSLTVSTGAGCTNTLVKTAYIRIQPVSISLNLPAGGCIPFSYTPQATINSLDNIVSYSWDLGEPGAVFNMQNPPPYTYTTAGSFTVSLTVTTASGCTQTFSVPNGIQTGIRPIPSFTFSPSNTCASDTIQFNSTSVTTPGANILWNWNFGDGSSADIENPQHVYMDTGMLTITLIVSNNRCLDSIKQTIRVIPPVALFNYTVDCNTQQVIFRDTSLVDPTLSPLTYQWQMGDPANTIFNVQHPPPFSYPGPGTYPVTLTVTNGSCSYSTTRDVIIANEVADFTVDRNPVCRNDEFILRAITSNPANVVSYEWTVDGVVLSGTGRNVAHRLPNIGAFDVTLTITDINGCVTTLTRPGFMRVTGPEALFVPANGGGCLSQTTIFTDQSTPAGNIRSWLFDFGDGTQQTFTAPPFTHTYNLLGGYDVTLTVTDAAGCVDSYTLPNGVRITNPTAGFRADTFYCPLAPLQFVDTSAGVGLSYEWDFGDGNTSTLQNPTHSYGAGDNDYSVRLIVTDASGCRDTVFKPNYIHIRSPKAAFSIKDTTTLCPPLKTTFSFAGSDYESFYWAFGDGGISTLQNPTYFYSTYGNFTPKLYLTGPGGCVDSAASSVVVHSPANFAVNQSPVSTACNSLQVDFNLVVPPGYKFIFYFGDGGVDSSQNTVLTHLYSRPSFSYPTLFVYDTLSGCRIELYGRRIDVLGAIPLFGMNRSEFCDNGEVIFTDYTTKNEPIIDRQWNFGDGNTSTDESPVHNYAAPGRYIVTLNVTTQSNCSKSYSDTVFVYRTPQPLIMSRDTICVNIAETITGGLAVADTMTTWNWNFGNGGTSQQQTNSVLYTAAGDYNLQLIATNLIGCSDTVTRSIHVVPPPTATPVQDPITIIAGSSTTLAMQYTGMINSYTWTPQYRLDCTNCPAPVANPQSTTTYTVNLLDNYGCRNSGNITVNVLCGNMNFFMPNTFSPNGDGQNDVFYPRGTGVFRIKSLTVFNRWGEIVFDKKDFAPNDRSAGWNGTYKGQPASGDVYIYMMEVLCENNSVVPAKGNVTLLR